MNYYGNLTAIKKSLLRDPLRLGDFVVVFFYSDINPVTDILFFATTPKIFEAKTLRNTKNYCHSSLFFFNIRSFIEGLSGEFR
jgi:hypothetical protein